MAKSTHLEVVVERRCHDLTDGLSKRSRFFDCVTIDPNRALDVWDDLSVDTFALELGKLPSLLHNSFICTLEKRSDDGRRQARSG